MILYRLCVLGWNLLTSGLPHDLDDLHDIFDEDDDA